MSDTRGTLTELLDKETADIEYLEESIQKERAEILRMQSELLRHTEERIALRRALGMNADGTPRGQGRKAKRGPAVVGDHDFAEVADPTLAGAAEAGGEDE